MFATLEQTPSWREKLEDRVKKMEEEKSDLMVERKKLPDKLQPGIPPKVEEQHTYTQPIIKEASFMIHHVIVQSSECKASWSVPGANIRAAEP